MDRDSVLQAFCFPVCRKDVSIIMQKTLGRAYRFFLWGFAGCFFLVLLRVAVSLTKRPASSLLLVGFSAVLVAACALMVMQFRKSAWFHTLAQKEWNRSLFAIFLFCIFALQCVLGWELRCNPEGNPAIYYDLRAMHNNALSLLSGEGIKARPYFAQYPHQLFPLLLLTAYYGVFKLLFGTVPLYAGIPLNIILLDCGILLLYLLARRLFGNRMALFSALLCMVFPPFYTYVPFFYLDTFSLPFTVLPLYLYVCAQQQANARRKIALSLGCGAAIGFGALLRPTILILLVAIGMHLLWASGLRRLWKPALLLVLAFLTLYSGAKALVNSQNLLAEEELHTYQFPKTHWIMMGLKDPMWNRADEEFTKASGDYEQKEAATIQEIKVRLQERGIGGTLRYLWKKSAFQWSDGTYRSGIYLSRSPAKSEKTLLHQFFLKSGKYYRWFRAYSQIFLFAILGLSLYSLLRHLRKRTIALQTVLYLTWMGVFLFFLFWEANPKYLLNFMPILFLCAADGFQNFTRIRIRRFQLSA